MPYIDVTTANEELRKIRLSLKPPYDSYANGFCEAIKQLNMLPTADVVEVVRCKDCIYNKIAGCTHSEGYDERNYNPDYFCADGEREEVGGDNTCVSCGTIIPEGRQVCPKCDEERRGFDYD